MLLRSCRQIVFDLTNIFNCVVVCIFERLYPIWFIAPILTFNCALLSLKCGAEFKIDPPLSYYTFIAETRGYTRANMIISIKESLNSKGEQKEGIHERQCIIAKMAHKKDWIMHHFKQALPASNINIYQQRILHFIAHPMALTSNLLYDKENLRRKCGCYANVRLSIRREEIVSPPFVIVLN